VKKINEPNSDMTNHISDRRSICTCVCLLSCMHYFCHICQIHKLDTQWKIFSTKSMLLYQFNRY